MDSKNNIDINNTDLLNSFYKYFFYWKYFLLSLSFFFLFAFIYIRYTNPIYETTAKIKVLDEDQNSFNISSANDFFKEKINLENEIEILNSSPVLAKVVKNLNLYVSVFEKGDIKTSRVLIYPFEIQLNKNFEDFEIDVFNLSLNDDGISITNKNDQSEYFFPNFSSLNNKHPLPFDVFNVNKNWKSFENNEYIIEIKNEKKIINSLKQSLNTFVIGKESDIIQLNFTSTNKNYSENILNNIIQEFNNDGIRDRRLVFKRTIDFVDNRYLLLSSQLDSVEIQKELYKTANDLIDIQANSSQILEKTGEIDQTILLLENKISLIKMLMEDILKNNYDLIPVTLEINDNQLLNELIIDYNKNILEKQKLLLSAGSSNPSLKLKISVIEDLRDNIKTSLKKYLQDLKITREKYLNKNIFFNDQKSEIPSNEKVLRSIERNQKIKETLYLFLLQKREEAEINYAITEPSIKVVEYSVSNENPIFPNYKIIYLTSIILGLFIPFIFLFVIFLYDTKIHSRQDIENYASDLNILGEIPFFDLDDSEKVFKNSNDRSIISESFRMLMSNVRYLNNVNSKSNVMVVTSSVKGEGKTLNALNLSLSFSSLGKKVLLIGCDLRNPQIHKYLGLDKNVKGLADYLFDNKKDWKKNVIQPFENNLTQDILLSGPLPPNPLNLINNGNLNLLLTEAREIYDYIIIDSAPTLLVADTKSILELVDSVIFLTRCNVTDRDILKHISNVSNDISANVGIVLNGVGEKNSYGYSYGYRYGYGYNYKYSYNYGYGYGYSSDDENE